MNTIKLGSKGEDVKVLQKYLGITADGDFGPNTDKKVKEWQKSKGLTPDGVIGPKSWAIILQKDFILPSTLLLPATLSISIIWKKCALNAEEYRKTGRCCASCSE